MAAVTGSPSIPSRRSLSPTRTRVLEFWVIAVAMRQELETHFRIVREKALARATQGK